MPQNRRSFLASAATTLAAAPLISLETAAGLLKAAEPAAGARPFQVACYYFPNYHPNDARNQKIKGRGWSEWELVKAAKPRFRGQHQPHVPLWGYTDEADPKEMARKIAAAADHGIDAFIFDWYWYNDGPYLERALDEGFLKAADNDRLKFALMWANHDWADLHPASHDKPPRLLFPGAVTRKTFDTIVDRVVERYFKHPSSWKIDGRPYFSVYDLTKLLASFGSLAATRAALDGFRTKTRAAGFPDLHLNAVVWGQTVLPGESKPLEPGELVRGLGFNSVTSYVWIHHASLPRQATDYVEVQQSYLRYCDLAEKTFAVPYYPNVTMGWDPSPRCNQNDKFDNSGYPFTNTISGNTPQRFQAALQAVKQRLEKRPIDQRVVTINAWNEWTEGSYLEPDTVHGMAYLEAIRDVFGKRP
jgi:hypothetical protein